MIKYPRTQHVEGSGVQSDDIKETVPFSFFEGKYLVIEEKVDGGCSGMSSVSSGSRVIPQARGHHLTGGDEYYWDDFKQFCGVNTPILGWSLSNEFIIFGEYMKVFHSVFYDLLPHYFLEFDIYSIPDKEWYSTRTRNSFIDEYIHGFTKEYLGDEKHIIHSVPVLASGICENGQVQGKDILDYLTTSHFISDQAYNLLKEMLEELDVPGKDVLLQLNKDRLMEGLYIKWEEDGIVKGRYKYVRPEFVNAITEQGIHWKKRMSIFNRLSS